jgi:hypothetical protein
VTTFLKYIKNIVLFNKVAFERDSIYEQKCSIDSLLNTLLIFFNEKKKLNFSAEDFCIFEIIYQNIKIKEIVIFSFKSLIKIISFFPLEQRKKNILKF